MNRRGFLGALMGGLVFDPERALWSPDRRKLISIPKPQLFWSPAVCEQVKVIQRLYNFHLSQQMEALYWRGTVGRGYIDVAG